MISVATSDRKIHESPAPRSTCPFCARLVTSEATTPISNAGPVINGYAFCDFANQQKIAARALQWTIDNPYKALFLPQVPARPGDRAQNLDKAIASMKANVAKERDYLANAANVARFRQQRKENEADRKFCWK